MADAIDKGVEILTSEGTKDFSLMLWDQINLIRLRNLFDKGCLAMPHHAEGEPIRL